MNRNNSSLLFMLVKKDLKSLYKNYLCTYLVPITRIKCSWREREWERMRNAQLKSIGELYGLAIMRLGIYVRHNNSQRLMSCSLRALVYRLSTKDIELGLCSTCSSRDIAHTHRHTHMHTKNTLTVGRCQLNFVFLLCAQPAGDFKHTSCYKFHRLL